MQFDNIKTGGRHFSAMENKFTAYNLLYANLVLPFNMELQTQSNWCWAATSKSVSRFYSNLSPWTQCKIAGAELSITCCTSPVPSACNIAWYLDKALARTNNFVVISGPVTWLQLRQELEKGLVIGTRIGWNGGGGHFMVIYGVSTVGSTEYVNVDDPIYGKSLLTYNQFATNYQGSGRWTHTYFTKKYNYLMWFKDLLLNTKLLKPIQEVRPLMNFNAENLMEINKTNVGKYDMPHYTFTVGLNEINNEFSLPASPKSLRIIEVQKEKPLALFEVGLNEEKPELIQMNLSSVYFNQLNTSLGKLKDLVKETPELGELRLIKIPALNLEAFWMHYDYESKDTITPIQRFENDSSINWEKGYNQKEFSDLLQKLAARIDGADELLGS